MKKSEEDKIWAELNGNTKKGVSLVYSSLFKPLESNLNKMEARLSALNIRLPSRIKEVEDIGKFIKQHKLVILDFSAEWCVPCYYFEAPLEDIAKKDKSVMIGKVDIDKHPEAKKWFDDSSMSIPMLLSFRDGKIVQRVVGSLKGQKSFDVVKWMAQRLKVPTVAFNKKMEWAKSVAKAKGWKLNPNPAVAEGLIAALVHNQIESGFAYCPCKGEKISQNICPCRPVENKYIGADAMIKKQGVCYCGLFVKG